MDEKREEMLIKLRNVRDTANQNLKGQEGYKNSVAQNVKYYGTIELINKENKEAEQHELYTVEIYDYETEEISTRIYLDGKEVDLGELIETYENIEPIKDTINVAKDKSKEKEEQQEEKEPEYRSYDLNELEQEEQEEKKEEIEDGEEQILDKEEVKELKISNTKGKIDLNQMIDGQTLRNIMGLDADYTYIAPVSSSSINLENTNADISFVALKNDNTAKILHDDVIKEDRQEGINSANKDKFVGNDGQEEEKSGIFNCIVGDGKYGLAVYRETGTSNLATTITRRSGRENTEGEVDIELHRQGDGRISSDSRNELKAKDGIGKSDEMKAKVDEHQKKGCNPKVKDFDSDKNNDTHFHITDEQLEELAEKTGENKDALKDRFDREQNKNPDKNVEQILKDIEEDYEMLRSHKHE